MLLAGTASLGLGFGLIGGPINAYPSLLFPHRSQTAIVAAHTLIGLGLAIGPLIAGPFIAVGTWFGFPISLASACAIAAIAALLIRFRPPIRAGSSEPVSRFRFAHTGTQEGSIPNAFPIDRIVSPWPA